MKDFEYEWGPWIEHDGKGCPLAIGEYAHLVGICADGRDKLEDIGVWQGGRKWAHAWHHDRHGKFLDGWRVAKIIRYRIRRPRIEMLLEPLTEMEPVEA